MSHEKTYQELISWLDINKEYKLLDDEKQFYQQKLEQQTTSLYVKLHYQCLDCNDIILKSLDVLKRSPYKKVLCNKCIRQHNISKKHNIAINNITKLCEQQGLTVDNIYREGHTWRINAWCKCGNYMERLDAISIQNSCNNKIGYFACPQCRIKYMRSRFKLTEKQLNDIASQKGCKLLSDYSEYKNVNTRLLWEMSCGHQYITSVGSLSNSSGLCHKCVILSKSGENAYNWNGGSYDSERDKITASYEYKTFCQQVKIRDGYLCQHCRKPSSSIATHHLDGFNWAVDKRLDISNGITLCTDCHNKFHSIYGRGNNTKEQFEEFQKLY